ncbi:MAG: hypothetical protein K6V73_05695 [Firmicutes bacterium]|nr:hypothetical protein [Bacillota bacterium]
MRETAPTAPAETPTPLVRNSMPEGVNLIPNDTLFVGIDIGLENNAHFLAPNGDSLGRLTFPNDIDGVGQLSSTAS